VVTEVRGTLDAVADLVFVRSEIDVNKWECIVPASVEGQYIVSLYLKDEAGNVSYYATILFTIDTSTLIFTIKVIDYNMNVIDDVLSMKPQMDLEYNFIISMKDYERTLLNTEKNAEIMFDNYKVTDANLRYYSRIKC